ncbi:hypothetical protein RAAC3_TM7C00001G0040 [Candidatus Saccharibacteria bacterium RAAC3_TM7_1]|nr:hypothetical protein RAAC3_TM7C00001G0040 [Candidatus Saccharibacteria bacterium RAAC3_TM7_1]HCZ28326.1 hypothetical protein [Candidatus Saccharibacteria bacterium]
MPSKNTVKLFDAPAYYHAYNRGVEKRVIFQDDDDYAVFMNIMKRYLYPEPSFDAFGREYERLDDSLQLVAFCLMPNHFHLLFFQNEPDAMTRFMRKLATTYSTYFNHKYHREGRLFQGTYKAIQIKDDSYFHHITRYIHLNPKDYLGWKWSSLSAYLGYRQIGWIHPERLQTMSSDKYLTYLEDYVDYRKSLVEIEDRLANGGH